MGMRGDNWQGVELKMLNVLLCGYYRIPLMLWCDLWGARKAPADTFNAAKAFALLGCGTGIVVWLGLFLVFGGALFQMWQTSAGALSLEGAFQYFGACAFIFLIVSSADD